MGELVGSDDHATGPASRPFGLNPSLSPTIGNRTEYWLDQSGHRGVIDTERRKHEERELVAVELSVAKHSEKFILA